MVKIAQS